MRHFFSFPALSYLSCSRSALPTREPVCPSLSFSAASLSLYFLLLLCGCFLSTIYLLAITNWEARVGPPMTKLSLQVSPAPIFFAIAKTLHSVSKKERKEREQLSDKELYFLHLRRSFYLHNFMAELVTF